MTITTTIKAGDSPQTITLHEGKALTLTGAAGAVGVAYQLDLVLGGTNSVKSWAVGTGALPQIGPYSGTQNILITCTAGSINATVGDAAVTNSATIANLGNTSIVHAPRTLLLASDSIGAISEVILGATSVVDNGDGTGTATKGSTWGASVGEPIRICSATTKTLNVMDSYISAITNGGNSLVFPLGGRTSTVTSPSTPSVVFPNRRGSRGYLNAMEMFLGISFKTTWCGVAGATSTQINTLLNETPQTGLYDVGVFELGMNDVYSALLDTVTAWPLLKAAIDNVRGRCGTLLALPIPPRDSSSGQWTAQRQTYHTQLNRLIYDYVLSIGGYFIDTWKAMQNGVTYVNPAATNPDPLTAFMFDTTHPAWPGALAIGRAMATPLLPRMGAPGWQPSHANMLLADSGNLLTDAAFAVDTNADGVSDGWALVSTTANMSVVPSRVQRTIATDGDGVGYNQKLLCNYGTATGTASTKFSKAGMQALVASYVGQKVQFKLPFSLTGAVGLIGLELTIMGTLPNSQSWQIYGNALDSSAKAITGSLAGTLMTPEAIVPAGLTNLDIWVRPYFNSTQTADMTLLLWQPDLRIAS
ncbi:SGNH/GDSL hydrolase family protein [Duganella violaceipulchra]|uniref:SGNH/GDSL hydrolase family protein n=1 Tax=Duganella violaceipulchra TaxID=2849652 RepID=A0AA41HD11_9BURK|nr:SGNH/GDSL hydrolase family protein [Duganella violaceicalia]MBV6321906.1 SGNH/GDSL hydrolase family protein [Duganella violaceicalia]MCP2007100.1 hypothetical protein [Duganella violaceicalia]